MSDENNTKLNETSTELTLRMTPEELVKRISEAESTEELKEISKLFNMNILKKEISRVSRQSDLLDKVLDQAEDRLNTRAGEMSTKDLLDYMNAFQNNIGRLQTTIEKIDEVTSPTIQINNTKNEVHLNLTDGTSVQLSRESKDKVKDKIEEFLRLVKEQQLDNTVVENDIIDFTEEEKDV